MSESSARPYLRDLPGAELHLLDGGHWALETNLDEIVALARLFRARLHLKVLTWSRRTAASLNNLLYERRSFL
jgi:hypothetical protein